MANYNRPIVANFGPTKSGLAGDLTYNVTSPDGATTHIAATSSGISEIATGSGAYTATPTFDTAWGFVLVYWLGPGGISFPLVINAADVNVNTSGGGGGNNPAVGQATFDPSLPTTKDQVRATVGDVSPIPQWFLDDRTITTYLSRYTYAETCARCAENIGAQCIQIASQVQQRNLKVQYDDRAKKMFELADRIRNNRDPEPGEPIRTGADAGIMNSPNLATNYIPTLGVNADDPNFPGALPSNPYGYGGY